MESKEWKPGQTCRWEDDWAVVSYVLPNGRVIITTDDGRQAAVQGAHLKDPVVHVPSMPKGRK